MKRCVARGPSKGCVKIADFGISKRLQGATLARRFALKTTTIDRHLYTFVYLYAPASLLALPPWAWSWYAPRPPCGPVVGVDWCECWLMES